MSAGVAGVSTGLLRDVQRDVQRDVDIDDTETVLDGPVDVCDHQLVSMPFNFVLTTKQ